MSWIISGIFMLARPHVELRDLPKKMLIVELAFCLYSKAYEHKGVIEMEKAILDMVAGDGADAQICSLPV